MKIMAIFLVLVAAVLVAPGASAAPSDLMGAWSGTAAGIRPDGTVENLTLTLTVSHQTGPLFSGSLLVYRLDTAGKVIELESLLFTGHVSTDNRISMTLVPTPAPSNPQRAPAAAVMHGTWSETGINAVWENLTLGNTGWASLKKQAQ